MVVCKIYWQMAKHALCYCVCVGLVAFGIGLNETRISFVSVNILNLWVVSGTSS